MIVFIICGFLQQFKMSNALKSDQLCTHLEGASISARFMITPNLYKVFFVAEELQMLGGSEQCP
jgi:hypothetical protein